MKTKNNNKFLKMLKIEVRLIILFIFIISIAKSQNISDGFDTIFVKREHSKPIIMSTAEKFLDSKKYIITDGDVFGLVDVETIKHTLYYKNRAFDMMTSKVTYNHRSEEALSPITELVYMVDAYIHKTVGFYSGGQIKYYVNDPIPNKTLEATLKYLEHDTDFDQSPLDIQQAKDSVILDIIRYLQKNSQQPKEN